MNRQPALTTDERDVLVDAAIQAPSMHNTQPWRFRFRGRIIEVHRDPKVDLPAEDPDLRMAMISTGAAVLNLRVAAARLGYETTVVLYADAATADGTLAAEVRLGDVSNAGTVLRRELAQLFPYVSRRRTSREPFAGTLIADPLRVAIVAAAADEGAMLEWVTDPVRRGWLLGLAADAAHMDTADTARMAERERWVGGQRDGEGIPAASIGPRSVRLTSPARDLSPGARAGRDVARFEREPALAVLTTDEDTPQARLVAGQALQRVLLVATRLGLSTGLLTQAIEHAELRWLVRDPLGRWAEPQVVLRFGYGPAGPATPRRPAESFVDR